MSATPIYDGIRTAFEVLRSQNVEPGEIRMTRSTYEALRTELGRPLYTRGILPCEYAFIEGVRITTTD